MSGPGMNAPVRTGELAGVDPLEAEIRTNILLVDDRPQNLLALETTLEPLGQNVVSAHSGEEALRKLLDSDFAVILLDVLMPGLDGFETATLIKERGKTRHIPIIFLTAASQHEQYVSRGYTVGAVDYIAKPFHPEILRAKVAVFVDLYRKNERIRRQSELLRQNEQRERERALEELRRLGEKRYQELAESMPQIVWSADAEGRTTYCNRRWFDYVGVPPQQKDGVDWKRVIHLDDLAEMESAWVRAREGASSFEVAARFRRASDGSYRWHLVRAITAGPGHPGPTDPSGTGGREWIGTSTDIDDRKRAEDGLRFLADASKELASSLDYRRTLAAVAELAVPGVADWCAIDLEEPDGKPTRVALVHSSPQKVELARSIERLYPPSADDFYSSEKRLAHDQAQIFESLPDAVLARTARDEQHLGLLRELRLESWILVPLAVRGVTIGSVRLATAESGRRYGPVDLALAEDLARRISAAVDSARLYEAAQRERTSLEEASRAKDEFLAVLSHELRSPLNAMLGWTQMLRSGSLDEATFAVALETIERSAKSQARLIGDILDVSRIITGKLRLNLGAADVQAVIRGALETVRAAAEAKEIEIVVQAESSLLPVQGDPERLQQVVWNLLSNAIKFTPRGGRIAVELARDRERERVVLSVRDNGIGIAPEFLPFIFDRFRQADSSTTRVHGGLGLGLSIVRHLIELHGGRVRAASPGLGHGATLTVELPYDSRRSARDGRAGDDNGAAVTSSRHELDGLVVLVVEDLADGRALFRAMLERSGARVRTAASANEALAALAAEWPDVLLSDIGLPGENGYELIRKVRALADERGSSLPALALTAYASESDREQALAAGFHGHITKPVERGALVRTVATIVDAARRQSVGRNGRA